MSIAPPDPSRSPVAIVVADGEHYPPAVRDAIGELATAGWDIRAVAMVGGTEKLRGAPDYGVPHHTGDSPVAALHAALDAAPDVATVLALTIWDQIQALFGL